MGSKFALSILPLPAAHYQTVPSGGGLRIIRPHQLPLVGNGELDNRLSRVNENGIWPIGLAELLTICGTDAKELSQLGVEDFLLSIERLQQCKTSGRKDHLLREVYDLWGLMNPENQVVIACLLVGLAKYIAQSRPLNMLFLGTGSGYPEVMCASICSRLGVAAAVTTVDYRGGVVDPVNGSQARREKTYVPLDGRNFTYGPTEDVDIGSQIDKAIAEGRLSNRSFSRLIADSNHYLAELIGLPPAERPSFDLVVVDANHLYAAVTCDLLFGFELLSPGGVLFVDDYGGNKLATNPGVTAGCFDLVHMAETFGYWVANPADPFSTNSAFFIKGHSSRAPLEPEAARLLQLACSLYGR